MVTVPMSSVLNVRRPRSSWVTSPVRRSPLRSRTTSVFAAPAGAAKSSVRPSHTAAASVGTRQRSTSYLARAGEHLGRGALLLLRSRREVLEHLVGGLGHLLLVLLRLVRQLVLGHAPEQQRLGLR